MKIILTESQYKKVLLKEFGETISTPKEWYDRILDWVDNRKDLRFDNHSDEVVAYDNKGVYLGYYDKEQEFGFVVTEYGIGMDDYTDEDEEVLDEQDDAGGEEAPSGGSSTTWPLADLARSVANMLDNSPHYTSSAHYTSSPWEDKLNRGSSNQLT